MLCIRLLLVVFNLVLFDNFGLIKTPALGTLEFGNPVKIR